MIKNDTLQNATREGKVGSMKRPDLQLAVAGLAEILNHRSL